MPEKTLEKISAWLKYQEDVFGRFQLPAGVNPTEEMPAEQYKAPGNMPSVNSETLQNSQPGNNHETNQTRNTSPETSDSSALNLKMHQPDRQDGKNTPNENPLIALQECTDLPALKMLCEQSSELKTDLAGTNLVFGIGNPAADLMLIGEAPGEREDLQGEPFVGKAGQLLNKILKAIGFDREQVYIANILKHRPPNNRDPLPEERIKSLPFLEKQIDLINPKLILCLGRISAQTLLETSAPMKDLRGRFHPYRDRYELMVTYHPAALLRNPNWKRGTWEDVQLLRKRYDELGGKP